MEESQAITLKLSQALRKEILAMGRNDIAFVLVVSKVVLPGQGGVVDVGSNMRKDDIERLLRHALMYPGEIKSFPDSKQ